MHLFLQGDIGIGKSTLLREALAQHKLQPGGFITQRLLENGSVAGFRALALSGQLPPLQIAYNPHLTGVFLFKGQRNSQVLAETIAQVEQQMRQQPPVLLLLDEIGGIELTNSLFMECLGRLLHGSTPCLGVLKSAANLAHTVKPMHMDAEYQQLHENIALLLREKGELLTLHAQNREQIRRSVDSFLAALKQAGAINPPAPK